MKNAKGRKAQMGGCETRLAADIDLLLQCNKQCVE